MPADASRQCSTRHLPNPYRGGCQRPAAVLCRTSGRRCVQAVGDGGRQEQLLGQDEQGACIRRAGQHLMAPGW